MVTVEKLYCILRHNCVEGELVTAKMRKERKENT